MFIPFFSGIMIFSALVWGLDVGFSAAFAVMWAWILAGIVGDIFLSLGYAGRKDK